MLSVCLSVSLPFPLFFLTLSPSNLHIGLMLSSKHHFELKFRFAEYFKTGMFSLLNIKSMVFGYTLLHMKGRGLNLHCWDSKKFHIYVLNIVVPYPYIPFQIEQYSCEQHSIQHLQNNHLATWLPQSSGNMAQSNQLKPLHLKLINSLHPNNAIQLPLFLFKISVTSS